MPDSGVKGNSQLIWSCPGPSLLQMLESMHSFGSESEVQVLILAYSICTIYKHMYLCLHVYLYLYRGILHDVFIDLFAHIALQYHRFTLDTLHVLISIYIYINSCCSI